MLKRKMTRDEHKFLESLEIHNTDPEDFLFIAELDKTPPEVELPIVCDIFIKNSSGVSSITSNYWQIDTVRLLHFDPVVFANYCQMVYRDGHILYNHISGTSKHIGGSWETACRFLNHQYLQPDQCIGYKRPLVLNMVEAALNRFSNGGLSNETLG